MIPLRASSRSSRSTLFCFMLDPAHCCAAQSGGEQWHTAFGDF